MVKSKTQMIVDLAVLGILILVIYYLKVKSGDSPINIVDGVRSITGG